MLIRELHNVRYANNLPVCRSISSFDCALKMACSISRRDTAFLVCEIPRSFERSSPSNFRTHGSFTHINSGKIFERDLVSSDSVAKSATQKPWVF